MSLSPAHSNTPSSSGSTAQSLLMQLILLPIISRPHISKNSAWMRDYQNTSDYREVRDLQHQLTFSNGWLLDLAFDPPPHFFTLFGFPSASASSRALMRFSTFSRQSRS